MSGALVLFLSTGRCGTQFFARWLDESAAGLAQVEHEPLEGRYGSARVYRDPDAAAHLTAFPEVAARFAAIDAALAEGRTVVETGWPIYGWIPHLLDRHGARCMVVHLVREPNRCAFSLASHGLYAGDRDDDYVRLSRLDPAHPRVLHREYAEVWFTLNPVERCFFHWLEINAYAEALKREHPARLTTLRAEDVLANPPRLVETLAAHDPSLAAVFAGRPDLHEVVDRWHHPIVEDVESLRSLPAVAALAHRYGYTMALDEAAIAGRFFP